jgi:hypothetical protein
MLTTSALLIGNVRRFQWPCIEALLVPTIIPVHLVVHHYDCLDSDKRYEGMAILVKICNCSWFCLYICYGSLLYFQVCSLCLLFTVLYVYITVYYCIYYCLKCSVFILCHVHLMFDTMLWAGRSQVRVPMGSLNFSVYLILLAAPWPWGLLRL